MNAAKPALTPEQRSFLEALFKDDAAFEEDALRVYASDASLRRGPVLAASAIWRSGSTSCG